MPELPELEVVKEVLQRRIVGQTIDAVRVEKKGGAIIIRDLTNRGFSETLTGSTIKAVARRGKFLILSIEPPVYLVLNPKLTGRLQLVAPTEKRRPKTHIFFSLSGGAELRYVDQKTMGQLYLTDDLNQVTDYPGLGPEPFDVSLDKFINNINELGNTGSPSAMIVASQNWDRFKQGDLLGLTVFGGGYSSGGLLIQF